VIIKYAAAISIIAGPVNKSKLADNIRPDIPEITEKTVAIITICIGVFEISLADAAGINKNAAMSNIPIN
jgi:hypothetical protein